MNTYSVDFTDGDNNWDHTKVCLFCIAKGRIAPSAHKGIGASKAASDFLNVFSPLT